MTQALDWQGIINDLLGKPYQQGARGPDAYDCWGVVQCVMAKGGYSEIGDWLRGVTGRKFRAEVARIMVQQPTTGPWNAVPVGEVMPFDVVLMSTNARPHHAGVITPLGILHAQPGLGVVLARTERQLRKQGSYNKLWYYRWAG